jgi:hypothetical protein
MRTNYTMQPAEIAIFAVTLFLALAALIQWKRRRDASAARVNRGLRGYVAAKSAILPPGPGETRREDPIPV